MAAAAEIGRNHVGMDMSWMMRDGTAEPASRDQILRRERGQSLKL